MPDIFDDLEAFHMPAEMFDRSAKPIEGKALRFYAKGESFPEGADSLGELVTDCKRFTGRQNVVGRSLHLVLGRYQKE